MPPMLGRGHHFLLEVEVEVEVEEGVPGMCVSGVLRVGRGGRIGEGGRSAGRGRRNGRGR
jgi:hypothetical protein